MKKEQMLIRESNGYKLYAVYDETDTPIYHIKKGKNIVSYFQILQNAERELKAISR